MAGEKKSVKSRREEGQKGKQARQGSGSKADKGKQTGTENVVKPNQEFPSRARIPSSRR